MITRDKIVTWAEMSGIDVRDYYDELGCTVNELQKFAERAVNDYKQSIIKELNRANS